MRFAGQRFRMPQQRMPRAEAQSGAEGDYRYRYQAQGLPPSRANMPEQNAASFTKTQQGQFQIPSFAEPEYTA